MTWLLTSCIDKRRYRINSMQASRTKTSSNNNLASSLGNSATHGSGEDTVNSLRGKLALVEKDLERRQESYVVRERAFRTRIEELESEIEGARDKKTGWMKEEKFLLF